MNEQGSGTDSNNEKRPSVHHCKLSHTDRRTQSQNNRTMRTRERGGEEVQRLYERD